MVGGGLLRVLLPITEAVPGFRVLLITTAEVDKGIRHYAVMLTDVSKAQPALSCLCLC